MKKKEFTVIVEQDEEGYFVAEVPGLPGCHTQAKSLDTLMKRVKESIALCLDEKTATVPKMHLVGVQRIAV
jgi:predicted RNase H-like HicB family nuclease